MTSEDQEKIHIVGICGSLRENGYTKRVVQIALEGAAEYGPSTHCIDLREYEMVFPFQVPKEQMPASVIKLRHEVRDADGIILGTPEYHGSFSGVIKNAIDLMGFEEFEGKMLGLVGVGGGSLGAINALNGLRSVGRQLHSWVVPQQASIPRVSTKFRDGQLTDDSLIERIKEVGRQVAKFTFLHHSKEVERFLKEWQEAPSNPGGSQSITE